MSIRFQADNELKRIIVDANHESTFRRLRQPDWMVSATRLFCVSPRHNLEFLVSHDKRTMPAALASFAASGGTCPGVLLVIPQSALIREVVEALVLIWADDRADDWRNLIAKIPF